MVRFDLSLGVLHWGDDSFAAISGPWGNGEAPAGTYDVLVRHAVDGGLADGFAGDDGRSWFIPIRPRFETSRSGLGIHPDGGVRGTRGCVGLVGDDAARFWSRWVSTQMDSRPTTLEVA